MKLRAGIFPAVGRVAGGRRLAVHGVAGVGGLDVEGVGGGVASAARAILDA